MNDLVTGFMGGAVPTNNNNLEEKMDIVAQKVNEDGTIIDGDDVVMEEEEEEEDEEINDDDVLNITAMWDIGEDALLEPGHEITPQEITAMNEMEDINTDHINEIAQNEDSVWNIVGRALLPGDFVEYTLMSHDNPDIRIQRLEDEIREIPEGHPAFVLDDPWASDDDDDVPEELAAWLEQQDNDEEPDAEMFGGAKKELTYVLEGRQNYFVNRLRNRYEDIAIKENKRGFQSYVRSCPSNMKRIPVILNQKEYNEMKDEIKDEKAKSNSPSDEDILMNLSFAQNLRIDKIEKLPITQTQNLKNNTLNLLSEKGWSLLLIILAWIACISFILYLSIKNPTQKRIFFSQSIILAIIAIVVLMINYEKKELNNEKFAIVYDKEIEVWSEPNKISELKFLLHEGTKVKQIDTIQDWVNIQLENGTLGWIQSSSIKTLN